MAKINLGGFGRHIAESGARVNWGPPYYSLPKYRPADCRLPKEGDIEDGWRFLGGEPSDKSRWEFVAK